MFKASRKHVCRDFKRSGENKIGDNNVARGSVTSRPITPLGGGSMDKSTLHTNARRLKSFALNAKSRTYH